MLADRIGGSAAACSPGNRNGQWRYSFPAGVRKLIALSVLVVLVSPFAYVSSAPAQQGALRWSEYAALKWSDQYVNRNSPVLSDSRLASPLIYFGFQQPIGFEDEGVDLSNQQHLVEVYYGMYRPSSPADVSRAICAATRMSGAQPNYVIYSSVFAENDTGVIGYLNSYQPASSGAQATWDMVVALDRIYDSGSAAIYRATLPGAVCSDS